MFIRDVCGERLKEFLHRDVLLPLAAHEPEWSGVFYLSRASCHRTLCSRICVGVLRIKLEGIAKHFFFFVVRCLLGLVLVLCRVFLLFSEATPHSVSIRHAVFLAGKAFVSLVMLFL